MRELTKSIFSFSWAMSLFGIQQTANLMSPEKAVKAFDAVSDAAREQFSEVMQSTFNAGDKFQRGAVDMTLGTMSRDSANPNKWVRIASDAAKQSAEAVTKGVQEVTSTIRKAGSSNAGPGAGEAASPNAGEAGNASQRQGWGPMPA